MLITGIAEKSKPTRASEGKKSDSSQTDQEITNSFDPAVPIIIFCQPNAGYYETMLHDVIIIS